MLTNDITSSSNRHCLALWGQQHTEGGMPAIEV
ncbi:hypothetical protein Cyagr_0736 [Cyanobium gracile PCC 6307]|uniref:Uncharacterized protein n=1 Tax=Cyanobium gracile (strain ATCC 27147 / PCC 6307) TaxID=292564 RepID=K9P5U7_CYAGP|nr:hypothetical protein Cyagr_0736 [Cyanobium gracile PCC 6307]